MHISCNDGVIKLSPLSFYAVLEVVEISHECFFYILSCSILYTLVNYRFKSGEFGGHSRGRMNSGVSLLAKTAFSMTSQLRHQYVVSCKYWRDILQFFSHTDY